VVVGLLEIIIYVLVGLCATIVGGFWGLGGGVFIMPALLIACVDITIAVPASLLQMLPSTFLTVRKQFPEIGWGPGSWGQRLALPLCGCSFIGGFFGKPSGIWLRDATGGATVQQSLYLVLLAVIFYKTVTHKPANKNGEIQPSETSLPVSAGAGFCSGLVSSLLGIGGGSITRPVMASFMNVPEKPVGLIARFSVFVTAIAGTISYLSPAASTLEKSPPVAHIISIALALAAGGVIGFPTGAKMHAIVLAAGRDDLAQRSFAIILSLIFISVGTKLLGFQELSQVFIVVSGIVTCVGLTGLTVYSNKER